MTEVEVLGVVGTLATAVATIVLVYLLWRTIKQVETTVKLSKIQTEFRFRPWIGPINKIELLEEIEGKAKFDVTLKNYGELPSTYLSASFNISSEMISKENFESELGHKFNLGPMLPNMEKHYWFFIDSELIQKAKDERTKIFIALFFEYPTPEGTSGYGMISEFIPKTDNFIHREMWVSGKNSI
jgi:hypothetical protein